MAYSLDNFPLKDAFKIALVKNIAPEDSDYRYVSLLNSYDPLTGEERGVRLFGPVYGKILDTPNAGHALSCKGFETVDYLHSNILRHAMDEGIGNSDIQESLIAGNVRKNNASWNSLVNAYDASHVGEKWAEVLLQAMSETFVTAGATLYIDGSENDDPLLVEFFHILEPLDIEDLLEVQMQVQAFILAYVDAQPDEHLLQEKLSELKHIVSNISPNAEG